METQARSISWEAPEHFSENKSGDWFFALIIFTVALVIVALIFGNALLALLCAVGGGALAISSSRPARLVSYMVSVRGVKIDDTLHPFADLHSFYISEDDSLGPQLLVKTKKNFTPLLVFPIPEEYIDEIDDIMSTRLEEELLEEPFLNKLLEFFGF